MKSFVKISILCAVLVLFCTNIIACSADKTALYNGEFLEKKLSLPYNIEGVLTQNGEKYDVVIDGTGSGGINNIQMANGDFKIKFMSGDVTEGLTVEFFDNGVFLFFDDLRFKTNSDTFTNLELLKNSFETLSEPYEQKYVMDTTPVDGIDLVEIGVKSSDGDIKAYVNKLDGTIIRLITNLNGVDITLDIKKFENVQPTTDSSSDEDTSEIFDVVDDYIET
ncbi:MAG: hypothetical protein FWD71_07015 [Oscillospiraceae bacterium]|nr:hypothetical protein [Oscillospiraceae bacterium]